jgi:hypothetical protein
VQVSATNQTITVATTALASVVKTLTTVAGSVRPAGAGHALHLVITDGTTDVYAVKALAIRLMDDTVLMAYSQAGDIATKAAGSTLHFAIDLSIDADTAATITFGTTDYALPMAGESSPGIIELATNAEVQAGTDTVRAVTPAGLASLTSTTTRRGLIELATNAEVLAGTDTARAVAPVDLQSKLNTIYGLTSAWTGTHSWTGSSQLQYATDQSFQGSVHAVAGMGYITGANQFSADAFGGATFGVKGLVNSAILPIPLNEGLRNGGALRACLVHVKPGATRSPGARMLAGLARVQNSNGALLDYAGASWPVDEDDGTTNTQVLQIIPFGGFDTDTILIDTAQYTYFAYVVMGNTSASANDTVFGAICLMWDSYVGRR